MATHYKGLRIAELLKDIDRLQRELDLNQDEFENEIQALRAIEGQATLAIAKAKLTALLGDGKCK